METSEAVIPHVVEDFSPGDRIYRVYKTKPALMGTVLRASGLSVLARMDNGVEKRIPVGNFTRKPAHLWGKALNLSQVSEGDRISLGGHGKPRIFATVLEFIPGEKMVVEMELPGVEKYTQMDIPTDAVSLEWRFAKWELEG